MAIKTIKNLGNLRPRLGVGILDLVKITTYEKTDDGGETCFKRQNGGAATPPLCLATVNHILRRKVPCELHTSSSKLQPFQGFSL
jgi:hypothetical protein